MRNSEDRRIDIKLYKISFLKLILKTEFLPLCCNLCCKSWLNLTYIWGFLSQGQDTTCFFYLAHFCIKISNAFNFVAFWRCFQQQHMIGCFELLFDLFWRTFQKNIESLHAVKIMGWKSKGRRWGWRSRFWCIFSNERWEVRHLWGVVMVIDTSFQNLLANCVITSLESQWI